MNKPRLKRPVLTRDCWTDIFRWWWQKELAPKQRKSLTHGGFFSKSCVKLNEFLIAITLFPIDLTQQTEICLLSNQPETIVTTIQIWFSSTRLRKSCSVWKKNRQDECVVPPERPRTTQLVTEESFAVRETASLGIMGAPRVPPLNPSETIVLSEHYRFWGA